METYENLARYLRAAREGLMWKLDGLSERDLRLPRTPTGTSLLGLVKHCAGVEEGYFGACLGRASGVRLPESDFDADPNGDLYALADEPASDLVEAYRQVGAYVDVTLAELPLDTPAHVPWWGDQADTTLGRLAVHVVYDISRHAGQADILREQIDGAAGLNRDNTNLWEPEGGWAAHVAKLTAIAEEFN